jgi:hypothetical protein
LDTEVGDARQNVAAVSRARCTGRHYAAAIARSEMFDVLNVRVWTRPDLPDDFVIPQVDDPGAVAEGGGMQYVT